MKYLLDEPLSEQRAHLLRSAAVDAPPDGEQAKARLLSVLSASASAGASTGASTGASSRLVTTSRLGTVTAALVTMTLFGAWYGSVSPSSTPTPTPIASSASLAQPPASAPTMGSTAAESPKPPSDSPAIGTRVADLPSMPTAVPPASVKPMRLPSASTKPASAPAPEMVPAPAQTSARATPGDELKAVDDARAAFVDGRHDLTLGRIASYRQTFPSGRFVAEIDALEVQALAALGRRAEARAKAARYLAEHPRSPYAQRVRAAAALE